MTAWSEPTFLTKLFDADAVTSATPLAASADTYTFKQLLLGFHSGCIGETCAVLLIAGGIYLAVRRVITLHIPLSFIGTVAVLTFVSALFSNSFAAAGVIALKAVLSGGLLLGAVFMATDYVTSPKNRKAKVVFGVGCGIITFVIRRFGSLPEGVSYSILLMNIITPHLDNMFKTKPFGMEGKAND